MKKILGIFVFAIMFGAYGSMAWCAEPVGIVISMYPGAFAERSGGEIEALTLKAPLYKSDMVRTDKTGKVQILFNDDTTLSLAPDSTVSIDDFVFDGGKPAFAAKVVKGMSRVITGKIVEQNPDGFVMSSPKGTVGIRGTVVTGIVGEDKDSFFLESIDTRHSVEVTQNANLNNRTTSSTPGNVIDVSEDPNVPNVERPVTPEEKALINQNLAQNKAGDGEDEALAEADGTSDILASADGINDSTKDIRRDPMEIIRENNSQNDREAFYIGYLAIPSIGDSDAFTGNFGFQVGVNTGTVSGAYMFGIGDEGAFIATDGAGSLALLDDGSSYFNINNFAVKGSGSYSSASAGYMEGNIGQSSQIGLPEETVCERGNCVKLNEWNIASNSGEVLLSGIGGGYEIFPEEGAFENYFGADRVMNASFRGLGIGSEAGFNINLLTGNITDAYLAVANSYVSLLARGGTGTLTSYADKTFSINWDPASVKVSGLLPDDVALSGNFDNGYFSATDASWTLNSDSGANGTIDLSRRDGSLPSSFTAYYSGYVGDGLVAFETNVDTGEIFDASFSYAERTDSSSANIYASGGKGKIEGNVVTVNWGEVEIMNSRATYDSAVLRGDISSSGTLVIRRENGGTGDINEIAYMREPEYVNYEKKGSVIGSLRTAAGGAGNYSFDVNLYSRVITNASLNVNTEALQKNFTGGSGMIYFESDRDKFQIENYKNREEYLGSMKGDFDGDKTFENIEWQVIKDSRELVSGDATDGEIRFTR